MKINNQDVIQTVGDGGVVDYNYFACTCDPEDEQYWKSALKDYLLTSNTDPVSVLIMDLHHTYHATVESIGCDMWFGISISASKARWVHDELITDAECSLFIQCDEVSYGLLAATMILKELGYDEDE